MNRLIQLKQTTSVFLVALLLGCFALSPGAQAVSPAPDGGYPNFTTAEGDHALNSLTTGGFNTAVGWFSLSSATTGSFNTGVGTGALDLNNGNENTATGVGALLLNTTGANNTANGAFALVNNTTGDDNTALGDRALQSNTTGVGNAANGSFALFNNTTGSDNTATGDGALVANTTGNSNTANGSNALLHNTTGNSNTANGGNALFNNTGNNNIALGVGAGFNLTSGDNNIDIGNAGVANEANTIRIGTVGTQTKTIIAGIFGVVVPNGAAVLVDTNGQLGTNTSSRRFKEEIKPMDKASEAILALKPVTFHYKSDKTNRPEFGLIAEEVAAINPDLVVRDDKGEIYTVRYEAVNAMLLNEFLKEHRTVQKQQKEIDGLKAELKEQNALIEKVSAQLELNKPAPQTVLNNQ